MIIVVVAVSIVESVEPGELDESGESGLKTYPAYWPWRQPTNQIINPLTDRANIEQSAFSKVRK